MRAYGWFSATLEGPTTSWLYCPLISLGLLQAELETGRVPWTTGNRAPVPEAQVNLWRSVPSAVRAIAAYAHFFRAQPHNGPVAAILACAQAWRQGSPVGDHLSGANQEAATPPEIGEILQQVFFDLNYLTPAATGAGGEGRGGIPPRALPPVPPCLFYPSAASHALPV